MQRVALLTTHYFTTYAPDPNPNPNPNQVQIETGRPHQIRIHTAFIGHPLVGEGPL